MPPFESFPVRRLLAVVAVSAAAAARADVVPVPGVPGAGGPVIQGNGPLTTVNLTAPARIEWQDFTLAAGRELRFQSAPGSSFASLNIVRSPLPAAVDGKITADGPFYLISPGGIQVGSSGRIDAPRVLLSTMMPVDESRVLSDGSGTFSPDLLGGMIGVEGTIETSGGPLVVLSGTVFTTNSARLRSAGGDVRIGAVDSAAVNVSPNGLTPLTPTPRSGSGQVNSTGWIEARRIEIVSDGFINNGGRITSLGQGNQVRLAAPEITHELHPDNSSVIISTDLRVDGQFRQVGPIINPNDGANPSVTAGLRQTPRLSTGGFIATVEPGQTQLSHAPLQAPQTTASAVPPPLKRAETTTTTLAVRRRGGAAVKKASFFGQRVKR